jgi:hypothetical protein
MESAGYSEHWYQPTKLHHIPKDLDLYEILSTCQPLQI